MEVVRKGLEVYPEDANLIKEELSYLLITGQTDEALANFDKAIENGYVMMSKQLNKLYSTDINKAKTRNG